MNAPFEQAQQMTQVWLDFANNVASAGMVFRPDQKTPPEIAAQMREATFAAMAQAADKFMRSDRFLGMMKQSLDASIAFRKRMNEFLTQAQHSVQGVAKQDLDAMSLAVQHLERRMLGGMEELCAGLDRINARLDRLESGVSQTQQKQQA
jgi:hypothetical protein